MIATGRYLSQLLTSGVTIHSEGYIPVTLPYSWPKSHPASHFLLLKIFAHLSIRAKKRMPSVEKIIATPNYFSLE